jgi:hypothetical protein
VRVQWPASSNQPLGCLDGFEREKTESEH